MGHFMRRARWFILFCGFAVVFMGHGVRALAQDSIAVVDVKRVMSVSEAAKSIDVQREQLKSQYLNEISVKEQALRDMEKAASAGGKPGGLAEEQQQALRQEYEKNLIEVRRFTQDKKRVLEGASSEAVNKLRDLLYVVVQEIAAEKKFDLVISNQNVIMAQKALDITDETLRRLNERQSLISLELKEE